MITRLGEDEVAADAANRVNSEIQRSNLERDDSQLGKVVRGTWNRPDKAVPAELVDASGAPIRLTPGKTWVELPDVSYAVDIVSPPPPPPTEATTTTTRKKKK